MNHWSDFYRACLRLALLLPIHTQPSVSPNDRGRGSTPRIENPLDGRGCVTAYQSFLHRHTPLILFIIKNRKIPPPRREMKCEEKRSLYFDPINAKVQGEKFGLIVGGIRWSGFITPRPVGRSARHRLFYVHRWLHS